MSVFEHPCTRHRVTALGHQTAELRLRHDIARRDLAIGEPGPSYRPGGVPSSAYYQVNGVNSYRSPASRPDRGLVGLSKSLASRTSSVCDHGHVV